METSDNESRPKLLDLFCGGGGAAMGYWRAGFDVYGVDVADQPDYPFYFVRADAMTFPLDGFDAIHASPPCQAFTQLSAKWRGHGGLADERVNLLTPTLERLRALRGVPWVVENVVGARKLMQPMLTLHGGMFGLGVHRPRIFESNVLLLAPRTAMADNVIGVYGENPNGSSLWRLRNNGNLRKKSPVRRARSVDEGGEAMGIDWLEWDELKEAIPPAYTEHIGLQLIEHWRNDVRAVGERMRARDWQVSRERYNAR